MITPERFDLKGKTALVTGCSRGIGRSMALALAEAGADIIGVSNTLQPGCDTEQQVKKTGRRFSGYAVNLQDRQSVYNFIAQVNSEHAIVDILVNNAGTILRNPAVQHSDAEWDQVLSVNLDTPFILAREFGRQMVE